MQKNQIDCGIYKCKQDIDKTSTNDVVNLGIISSLQIKDKIEKAGEDKCID